MAQPLPLPRSTARLVEAFPLADRHPGLQLDKLLRPAPKQEDQRDSLADVGKTSGDVALLRELAVRRDAVRQGLQADTFCCETTGPLTLHLARAAALENAGICLHPLYGFAYLPGSGLKGMARAYAETVWLPAQFSVDGEGQPLPGEEEKAERAWRQIEAVFGWAPGSDKNKTWKPRGVKLPKEKSHCGDIVFHDAWPEQWPRLHVDIVNNHHPNYYQGNDAPGDWDSPNPVYFLAVGASEKFSFALCKRHPGVDDELLQQAREWLTAALACEGAGAKTAAGYGRFRLCDDQPPVFKSPSREIFEATLELVSPAFLAGANQDETDCDLRPATLRGLLRWWWRTMHAGFVDRDTLRALETAVWGDAQTGGAVRLVVERVTPLQPERYDKQKTADAHGWTKEKPQQTKLGLWYNSYGMHDGRNQRHFMPPGATWKLRLVARRSSFAGRSLDPEIVLEQAKAALALFCCFGGAGSRSRKGFGSFADLDGVQGDVRQDAAKAAHTFRRKCGCDGPFQEQNAESPALEKAIVLQIFTPWTNPWFALARVGAAAQSFAQQHKHQPIKAALGLPRQIHGPRDRPLPHQDASQHRKPQPLRCSKGKGNRYASPAVIHLAKADGDNLVVRVAAFPARYLPDLKTSHDFLQQFLDHLKSCLSQDVAQHRDGGPSPPPSRAKAHSPKPSSNLPQTHSLVEAVLVEDPKRKNRRWAKHEPSGLAGNILNPEAVPPEKQIGDKLTLRVHSLSVDGKQIQFRVPTEGDQPKPPQKKGGSGFRHKRR